MSLDVRLTCWLISLQNNPNLENPTPTECIVPQSGKTQEIEHVSIGLSAYNADQPLEEVIFLIKFPSNKTVFKIHRSLKLSYHMETYLL